MWGRNFVLICSQMWDISASKCRFCLLHLSSSTVLRSIPPPPPSHQSHPTSALKICTQLYSQQCCILCQFYVHLLVSGSLFYYKNSVFLASIFFQLVPLLLLDQFNLCTYMICSVHKNTNAYLLIIRLNLPHGYRHLVS
jgi:hypothetical protein